MQVTFTLGGQASRLAGRLRTETPPPSKSVGKTCEVCGVNLAFLQNHINYIFHGCSMINDHGSQYGSIRHSWTNGKDIEAFQSLNIPSGKLT